MKTLKTPLYDDVEFAFTTSTYSATGNTYVGITRASVYGIIPTVRSLIKIADYLNVSIPYLLGESDEENFFKSDPPTTFHARLKQLTEENNTKFSSISNKMPFAKNSIYEWMRTGALPSLEYLYALANYFHVSVDYLLGRTDDKF